MKPNKPLAAYARAAHGLSSPAVVVRKEEVAPADEDEEVLSETLYHFSDGTVLQYRIEIDAHEGAPPEAAPACLPMWISYRIMQHPPEADIAPEQKTFANTCRQFFWLKMQA